VKPKAVFIETNWVVDFLAPPHLQKPEAAKLLERAAAGEFTLYLPSVSLAEARETIPRRFSPQARSDGMRKFVLWARAARNITDSDADAAYRVLDKFDNLVGQELEQVPQRLEELKNKPGLTVFPLSEQMLEYNVELGAMGLSIKPYDLAILASILVKAKELMTGEHSWSWFCELDSDLTPWSYNKRQEEIVYKQSLCDLYDKCWVRVHGNFSPPANAEPLLKWIEG